MNNRKKIAIITPGFKPVPAVRGGAIEQLIQYFIEGNEEDYQYDIEVYTIDDPLLDNYSYKHSKLIRIKDEQKFKYKIKLKYGIRNRINRLLKNQKTVSYIGDSFCHKFKQNYYDIVLVENNMNIYREMYSKFQNEEVIFHLHNDFDCGDEAKTKEKTEFILQTANKILVVSKFLKEKLLTINPKKEEKIIVAYNGIVSKDFRQLSQLEKEVLKKKLHIKNRKIIFTFVGRLCSEKGIDKFIEAMQKLKEKKNIEYIIVGDNFLGSKIEDSYIAHLKDLAKGLKDRIHFTGYVKNDDMYKLYSISDCVVIPTQVEETFSVVALEAMSMGCPVIASNSGGLSEILSNKCAVFIQRNDFFVKNLSIEILKLSKSKKMREKMGKEGQKRSKRYPQSVNSYFNELSSSI